MGNVTSTVGIGVPGSLFIELAEFLRNHSDPRDPTGVVQDCIRYWLDNASWKPELLASVDSRGFQWKEVFLVAGTQIRMPYKGQFFYAKVEGDSLIFEGQSTTPGAMVNTITQSSRNAWRDIWVRRPGDHGWIPASDLRKARDA
jgi:hypothetical protein